MFNRTPFHSVRVALFYAGPPANLTFAMAEKSLIAEQNEKFR